MFTSALGLKSRLEQFLYASCSSACVCVCVCVSRLCSMFHYRVAAVSGHVGAALKVAEHFSM